MFSLKQHCAWFSAMRCVFFNLLVLSFSLPEAPSLSPEQAKDVDWRDMYGDEKGGKKGKDKKAKEGSSKGTDKRGKKKNKTSSSSSSKKKKKKHGSRSSSKKKEKKKVSWSSFVGRDD